jgi:hypothetical protein
MCCLNEAFGILERAFYCSSLSRRNRVFCHNERTEDPEEPFCDPGEVSSKEASIRFS